MTQVDISGRINEQHYVGQIKVKSENIKQIWRNYFFHPKYNATTFVTLEKSFNLSKLWISHL